MNVRPRHSKDTVVPALKKAGIPWYAVSEQIFGDRPVYTTIRPLDSFAELDGPGALERAGLTQKQRDAFNAIADDSIVSQKRFIVNNQTEFSIPATGPNPVSVLTVIRANPGQAGALRDLLRTSLLPAMRAAKQAGTIAGFGVIDHGAGQSGIDGHIRGLSKPRGPGQRQPGAGVHGAGGSRTVRFADRAAGRRRGHDREPAAGRAELRAGQVNSKGHRHSSTRKGNRS